MAVDFVSQTLHVHRRDIRDAVAKANELAGVNKWLASAEVEAATKVEASTKKAAAAKRRFSEQIGILKEATGGQSTMMGKLAQSTYLVTAGFGPLGLAMLGVGAVMKGLEPIVGGVVEGLSDFLGLSDSPRWKELEESAKGLRVELKKSREHIRDLRRELMTDTEQLEAEEQRIITAIQQLNEGIIPSAMVRVSLAEEWERQLGDVGEVYGKIATAEGDVHRQVLENAKTRRTELQLELDVVRQQWREKDKADKDERDREADRKRRDAERAARSRDSAAREWAAHQMRMTALVQEANLRARLRDQAAIDQNKAIAGKPMGQNFAPSGFGSDIFMMGWNLDQAAKIEEQTRAAFFRQQTVDFLNDTEGTGKRPTLLDQLFGSPEQVTAYSVTLRVLSDSIDAAFDAISGGEGLGKAWTAFYKTGASALSRFALAHAKMELAHAAKSVAMHDYWGAAKHTAAAGLYFGAGAFAGSFAGGGGSSGGGGSDYGSFGASSGQQLQRTNDRPQIIVVSHGYAEDQYHQRQEIGRALDAYNRQVGEVSTVRYE